MFYVTYINIDQLAPLEIVCLIQQHTYTDYISTWHRCKVHVLCNINYTNTDQLAIMEIARVMQQNTTTIFQYGTDGN